MGKTVADVLEMGKEVQMVDLRFTDLLGMWHHFSLPVRELSEGLFEEGIGFDGSSIRAFQEIHESDMILIPDPETAFIDQVFEIPTIVITMIVVWQWSRSDDRERRRLDRASDRSGNKDLSDYNEMLAKLNSSKERGR